MDIVHVVPSRHGGPAHRIIAAGTPVASCLSCEAALHGRKCWAAREETALTTTARSIDSRDFQERQPPIDPTNDRAMVLSVSNLGAGTLEMRSRMDMMVAQLGLMKEFFERVMEPGVDYGVIPGTKKPSLWKPGAEKLANLFGWRIAIPHVDEAYSAETGFYRARVELGLVNGAQEPMGIGVGEANSFEGRFRYRWIGDKFARAEAERRHIDLSDLMTRKAGPKNRQWTEFRFENEDPWSQWNNVLKQAKKRALIDVVMACTRATGLFSRASGIDSWLHAADPASRHNEEPLGPEWDDVPEGDEQSAPPLAADNPLWKEGDETPPLVVNFEKALADAGLNKASACLTMGGQWKVGLILNWFERTGYSVAEAVEAVRERAGEAKR
jgi:hypothetical protein